MPDPLPSLETLTGIVQSLAEGIAVEDASGKFTFVNPACARLLGYTPAELIGRHRSLIIPPDQSPLVDAADQRRRLGQVDHYEVELVRKDGHRITVWVSGTPQRIEGAVCGSIAVFTDITERKLTEAAEHRHRVQAETLTEVTMALASHTRPEAVLEEILRQARRLVPYETANVALLEDGLFRVAHWQGYERYGLADFISHLSQKLEDLPGAYEAVVQRQPEWVPDTRNSTFWVPIPETLWIHSFLAVPIVAQDRVLGLLRFDSDLPGRFTLADAERLRPLANAAGVALEHARLFDDAHQRAAELEAVRQASLSLTAHLDLEAVLHAILQASLALVRGTQDAHIFLYRDNVLTFGAALVSGAAQAAPVSEPRLDGLTYNVARSGEMIVVNSMCGHPLFAHTPDDWQGGIIGLPLKIGPRVVGVMNIATLYPHTWPEADRRILNLLADQAAIAIENARLHDEIRFHATQLEQRVAERTTELRQAVAGLAQREAALAQTAAELQAANESLRQAAVKLQELDRLKTEFLSNVSHELRTPLSNVKLYLDLVDRGKPGKLPQYMATLHREANLLQSLIEDLLQISRLDLGQAHPDLQEVEVNALVANLVGDRRDLAASRGLSLSARPATGVPAAQADRRMLTQVLSNIITNAINYTPADGAVCVETGHAEADGRPWVTLAVRDTGPGIAPDELPHIFERFYRGAAARDARAPGTGLGLPICQELVLCQGGRITVESGAGQGSVFTVWLPVAGPAALPGWDCR